MKQNPTKHYELADILGPTSSEQEALSSIFSDKELCEMYADFPVDMQRELLDFLMGKSGLRITYDPFFKMIFDPEIHPERPKLCSVQSLKSQLKSRKFCNVKDKNYMVKAVL